MSVRIRPIIVSSLDPQILATTLTASVLTSLQDYITVFNGSGHAIYYNKELTPLCHCRRPSSRNGFQPDINMDELNITTDLDCQELQNDIQKALREGVAFAGGLSKQAVLKCDAYPDGLMIYYELNKLSMDMEALTEYTEDKCAIVLVIRPLVPASPSVSVHDSLEGVLDNINGILLHTLSPASITTAIRSRSSSGYDFVPTSGGSSGAAMPVESLWTIAERVDLIRRSLDELIVTLHPRISTSRSSGYPNNHSSSSSGSGSSRRLGTNGNVGNAALLYTEPVLGEEGNDDMLSSRGTGAPSMSCTFIPSYNFNSNVLIQPPFIPFILPRRFYHCVVVSHSRSFVQLFIEPLYRILLFNTTVVALISNPRPFILVSLSHLTHPLLFKH